MEKKFKILRLFGTVYKVLGVITMSLAVLGAAGICIMGFAGGALLEQATQELGAGGVMGTGVLGVATAFSLLLSGGIGGLSLYAIGELIYLFISMEENTRATAALLRQQSVQ